MTAEGAAVASLVIDGFHDSQGRRAYFSYQPSSTFYHAVTQNNTATGDFRPSIKAMSGEYVTEFLQLRNLSNLENLNGVTYDTLAKSMTQGWQMYEDNLQTTWPDLKGTSRSTVGR